jgi:hypothetical protein
MKHSRQTITRALKVYERIQTAQEMRDVELMSDLLRRSYSAEVSALWFALQVMLGEPDHVATVTAVIKMKSLRDMEAA